jgi:hypothetical protein
MLIRVPASNRWSEDVFEVFEEATISNKSKGLLQTYDPLLYEALDDTVTF